MTSSHALVQLFNYLHILRDDLVTQENASKGFGFAGGNKASNHRENISTMLIILPDGFIQLGNERNRNRNEIFGFSGED